MLPITKSIPKEMLPVANKPLVQYAIEEAVASGIEEIILVTRPADSHFEQYFAFDPQLEQFLAERNQAEELKVVKALSSRVHIVTVHQLSPRGLGDAVLCARTAVAGEPFALILPDAIIDADVAVTSQLISKYKERPACYVATQSVAPQETSRFGMLAFRRVEPEPMETAPALVSSLFEKPQWNAAPSQFGVFGRYLLTPQIFGYLDSSPEHGGIELDLTLALNQMCHNELLYAVLFEGRHFDAGSRLGYLQANLAFGLKDPKLALDLRRYLAEMTEQFTVALSHEA